ncbi:unnamed protein product, partial [Brassica oleracea var. botrytis]
KIEKKKLKERQSKKGCCGEAWRVAERERFRHCLVLQLLLQNCFLGFPASRVIPWVRLGSGPASPGKFF